MNVLRAATDLFISEGIFTCVYVFVGAAIASRDAVGPLAGGFGFGLTALVLVAISGIFSQFGHQNPSITMVTAFNWALGWEKNKYVRTWFDIVLIVIVAILFQSGGAVVAGLLLKFVNNGAAPFASTPFAATFPNGSLAGENGKAFLVEFIISAILILVVLLVRMPNLPIQVQTLGRPIVIGFISLVLVTLGIDFGTGGSMNFARSLGTAVAANIWTAFWIYVVAPMVGSIAGWILYALIRWLILSSPPKTPKLGKIEA